MKFLIDECLSPSLVALARKAGFPESTHTTWIGLRSQQDWKLVQRAIYDGYALVTHNTADFTALMGRRSSHPGLVCFNVAHGLMSLNLQQQLFEYAMTQISDEDLSGQIIEITLTPEGEVRFDKY